MDGSTSLVPVVANAVVAVSSNITGFVTKTRAKGVVERGQLEYLRDQTAKVLADVRACHLGDLVATNLEQLARTQYQINNLEREGRLVGNSLIMAMDQLSVLNNLLQSNLRNFINRDLR